MEKIAIFAGGCFWCMQHPFDSLKGVRKVVVGYTGGKGKNPTYEDYAEKRHVEAIQVFYDVEKVSYEKLLDVFFRQVDPTDSKGQFCDRGKQYRPVIFYQNSAEKKQAEDAKKKLNNSKRYENPLTIEILKALEFYLAEEYHQDYYKKNPIRYRIYRFNCGRDAFLKKVLG